jgi:GNAT superfamily N-acetyltransferase
VIEIQDPDSLIELARLVPDEPRWIDYRGLLASGRCRVWAEPDPVRGFVARALDEPFAAVWGEPGEEAVRAAIAGRGSLDDVLVAPGPGAEAVAAALPGWQAERVTFHVLPGPIQPDRLPAIDPPAGADLAMLAPESPPVAPDLAGLPPALRSEVAVLLARVRPLIVARVPPGDAGRIVSVCSAPWETETLWDVSIETLPGHRRRGLAAACFAALARWMAVERAKRPVWGAHESNPASLALAARLGFVRDSELLTYRRAG